MLIYLKPLSIFPELHSDTLFGAITYAISQLYPEKVDEMVKSFEDEPPFIISSTFPFIFKEDFENGKKIKFYPKIIFPQKSKDLEEKYHPKDFKEYKKVKFIEENLFFDLLKGRLSESDILRNYNQYTFIKGLLMRESYNIDVNFGENIIPNNSVNRITNETEGIFYTSGNEFKNMGLFFLVEFMDYLNSLNLTVKEANIVINQIKHEITTGECCLEAIPIRLNYLLKQLAPEITKYVVPSKELIAKKELIFLLNLKDNITFCPNCQSSLFLTDKFCYKCGAKNMQSIAIKAPKDDDLNLNEIYCAKLYEKYPLNFKYAYVCFLRYVNENPGKVEFPVFNNIDGFKLKKQAVKDNYFTLGDPVYSISNYTISDIKKVLKKYDLKVSGKKDELIERISKNLSDDEINNEFENSTFVLTSEAENF